MSTKFSKIAVVAAGLAAVPLLAALQPAQAASARHCVAVANEAVANDNPRRGLLGAVVALPLDVTGAVLTGYTTYDLRKKRVYDQAYANCISGTRVAVVSTSNFSGYKSDWIESCAARYRSFDPTTGTYVTYDGRIVACR